MITEEITINKGRLFVGGDIHGMFDLLEKTLKIIGFDEEKDTFISVGDLIDRGCESHRFQEFLKKPYFSAVLGNHEEFMIHAVLDPNDDNIDDWHSNGGDWALNHAITADMISDIINLPVALTINFHGKKIGIVHAGVPYDIDDWNVLLDKLEGGSKITRFNSLWDRNRAKQALNRRCSKVENIDLVISGHTIQKQVFYYENSLFLDTGAFHLSKNYEDREDQSEFGLSIVEVIIYGNGDLGVDPCQYDSDLYLREKNIL